MKALRWSARLICLGMFAFAAPFYAGEEWPGLADLSWYDSAQLILVTASLLAMLLAWRWELAAGLILTASGALTSLIALAAGFGPFTPLNFCLVPGLLLLACARGLKKKSRRSA
ncbi:hypothetical protein AAU61_00810 [Desulfocarbo indianensis]|nr:hypothetical protein AAU61_00810 [Desulfocarbo indianensis]